MIKYKASIVNNEDREELFLSAEKVSDVIQMVWDLRGMNVLIESIKAVEE